MGKNSVFDDIGLGASDLGLAPDPDEVKRNQDRALAEQEARLRQEQETAANEAKQKEEADRQLADSSKEAKRKERGRSRTLLTGGQGLEDSTLQTSRRTLLGS